ncbi:nucleic-acid-binding protein from mobile element jockey [Elysia marginata]|uniref:Nucleic-acid-binding protein from mobile element jockey n=1 Tax=Elysia marginata TaxID=1093978 RepID=A0AAV4G4K8_9GAST|nr:nucleic-acid-binding protein from mobile element jockey [Elysia marginata]
MRCFRCHRFGHGRDCKRKIDLCVKCGEPGHRREECDRSHKCINCKGDYPASSKNCPKYLEEQAILRYRAHNCGTFGQARVAAVVEVAKEVRPKLYAQAVRGGPVRRVTAPVTAQNKTESLPMAQNSATKKARPTNDKPRTGETRKTQTFERYGTNPEVDLESIDSIWSVPKDFCRAGRRAGGTSLPRPAPRRQSPTSQQPSPSQQSPLLSLPLGLLPRIQTVGIWTLIWDPPYVRQNNR